MERINKMYLNVKDPESYKYDVIDLNNGMKIPGVQEANDETGEFTIIMKDLDGNWIKSEIDLIEFKFKGNIKLVRKEN